MKRAIRGEAPKALAEHAGIRAFLGALLIALVAFTGSDLTAQAAPVTQRASQADFREVGGVLGDGTEWIIRVPSNWNGVLLRDLDVAGWARNTPLTFYLLSQGYALSGTARHERRYAGFYDPAREIRHLETVHDFFLERFGTPSRVIQYGCSGGGHVTLAIAEQFPDRVDGAIAYGPHTPVWYQNHLLDGWFVLQTLLAPDLTIVNLPDLPGLRPRHEELTAAWREVVNAAQRTPEGRARLALAVTIGQWPAWVTPGTERPSLDDVEALQYSIYQTVYELTDWVGGYVRDMFERAASEWRTQLSWNTGVDYREFFENGNESLKRAVRQLYEEAGADLELDLRTLNEAPRVEADSVAIHFWSQPGRTVWGDPQVPVLRVHDIGDDIVMPAQSEGYLELIRANGKEDLYREVFTANPTHCGFAVGEVAAAVETMMRRLDTGRWGPTDPEAMNALGSSMSAGGATSFVSYDELRNRRFNRTWTPSAEPPARAGSSSGVR
jgi:pimeloyl-ACP methyl ester carboxylesterase